MSCEGFVLLTKIPTFSPCHDPLVRPSPTHLIPCISVLTGSGTDRSFQWGRAHSSGLYPPTPTGPLFTTCPCAPAPPFLIICPHPSCMVLQELSLLVHPWNELLIVIVVCASLNDALACYPCSVPGPGVFGCAEQ